MSFIRVYPDRFRFCRNTEMVDAPCIHPRTRLFGGIFFGFANTLNSGRQKLPWLLLLNLCTVSEDFVAISRY